MEVQDKSRIATEARATPVLIHVYVEADQQKENHPATRNLLSPFPAIPSVSIPPSTRGTEKKERKKEAEESPSPCLPWKPTAR